MDRPEFEVSGGIERDARDSLSQAKQNPASARLRHALDELQQVAERAVASAVESDLNAAISQAAQILESLDRYRQPVEKIAAVPASPCEHHGVGGGDAPFLNNSDENSAQVRPFHFGSAFELRIESNGSSRPRMILTAAICACLFLAVVLVVLALHRAPVEAAANVTQSPAMTTSYDADPRNEADGQVLTVMVAPQQTLRELSLLYVGHFDGELLKEIRALNPELKDPDHIEPGQLVRIPLPQGTLKKVTDTADVSSASKAKIPSGLVARVFHWLGGA